MSEKYWLSVENKMTGLADRDLTFGGGPRFPNLKTNAGLRFGNGRIRSDGAHVYSVPGSADIVIVDNHLIPERKVAVTPDLKPGDVKYEDEPKRRP